MRESPGKRPRVVVVGAGFGGLWIAKRSARYPVDVILVDRNNYHTFLPLLYQVAPAEVGPKQQSDKDIAEQYSYSLNKYPAIADQPYYDNKYPNFVSKVKKQIKDLLGRK